MHHPRAARRVRPTRGRGRTGRSADEGIEWVAVHIPTVPSQRPLSALTACRRPVGCDPSRSPVSLRCKAQLAESAAAPTQRQPAPILGGMHGRFGLPTGWFPVALRWALVPFILAGVLAMHALNGPGEHHSGMPAGPQAVSAATSMSGMTHAPGLAPADSPPNSGLTKAVGAVHTDTGTLMATCIAILLGALLLVVLRRSPIRLPRSPVAVGAPVGARSLGGRAPPALLLHQLCVLRI